MTESIAIRKTRITYLLTLLFIAANIGLPHLFHLIPGGGVMFLPIYFFTAFAAVSYGMWTGILTGIMSPLLGYMIFGAPQAFMIPDMILKGVLLSLVLSYSLNKVRKTVRTSSLTLSLTTIQVITIPLAVVIAWSLAGVLELMIGMGKVAFQDFFTGIPGLLMMTLAGWIALFFNRQIAK